MQAWFFQGFAGFQLASLCVQGVWGEFGDFVLRFQNLEPALRPEP